MTEKSPFFHSPSLEFNILSQPTDSTCGPTCLQAIYSYFKDPIDVAQVIDEVHAFDEGGTLAVWLGCHALKRGYEATIYTYNLHVFDPTWFTDESTDIAKKLEEQLLHKQDPKLKKATNAYLDYLRLGGLLKMKDFNIDLMRKYLALEIPILAGLSSTYLYKSAREFGSGVDDVRGQPGGHFVVLCGYDQKTNLVSVADPYEENPFSSKRRYHIPIERVICSILLGILTYDANFLVIQPRKRLTS
jgi:hypothetical protein